MHEMSAVCPHLRLHRALEHGRDDLGLPVPRLAVQLRRQSDQRPGEQRSAAGENEMRVKAPTVYHPLTGAADHGQNRKHPQVAALRRLGLTTPSTASSVNAQFEEETTFVDEAAMADAAEAVREAEVEAFDPERRKSTR